MSVQCDVKLGSDLFSVTDKAVEFDHVGVLELACDGRLLQ